MLGILLASVATLIGEVGNTIGKNEVQHQRETYLGMGFSNFIWGIILWVLLLTLVPTGTEIGNAIGQYTFSFLPLPLSLFIVRFMFEIAIITLVLKAVILATRATFSFLRVVTIPLLLLADVILGYSISTLEVVGIGIIIVTTLLLIGSHTIRREGMWHIIAASLLAVITVSVYKFNITYYNSVQGEQLTMTCLLTIYLGIAAVVTTKKNPLRHFKRPQVIIQSFSTGVNSIITSIAFIYAAASIIMTARRASAILWSILAGKLVFNEQKLSYKFAALGAMCFGLYLLTL
jgi:hypothetical protein